MPSPAQIEAGNYPKKHLRLHGLPITIENRKGSIRRGKSPDGTPWEVQMPCDYGYIRRTVGADGDQVDVFVGPDKDSQLVVVVNQHDPVGGQFDEHKLMFGFRQLRMAQAAYRRSYQGVLVPRPVFQVTTVPEIKKWLKSGRTWGRTYFDYGNRKLTALERVMRTIEFRQPAKEEEPSALRKVLRVATPLAMVGGAYYLATRTKGGRGLLDDFGSRPKVPTPITRWGKGETPYPDVAPKPTGTVMKPSSYWNDYPGSSGAPAVNKTPPPPPAGTSSVAAMKAAAKAPASAPFEARGNKKVEGTAQTPKGLVRGKSLRPPKDPSIKDEVANMKVSHLHKPAKSGIKTSKGLVIEDVTKEREEKRKARKLLKNVAGAVKKDGSLRKRPGDPVADQKLSAVLVPNRLVARYAREVLFNRGADDFQNMMGASDSIAYAYRRGRRMVPWIRRGTQVTEDLGDMATGKKVKDPFYKKTWFKSAAMGAAIGAPFAYSRKVHSWNRQMQAAQRNLGADIHPWKKAIVNRAHSRWKDGDRPFLSAKVNLVELARQTAVINFDTDAELRGWDVRDARGRSARVYAPGSRRRQRREKEWNEKTDNIRLVRNAALLAAAGGIGGAVYYRHRLKKATGQPGDVKMAEDWLKKVGGKVLPGKTVSASAKTPGVIELAKKDPDETGSARKGVRNVGLGLAAVGAATLPAAVPILRIPVRSKLASMGVARAAENLAGKNVADYITAAQRSLNTGPHGKIAGKVIARKVARQGPHTPTPAFPGTTGEHLAGFRSSPAGALDHWTWEAKQGMALKGRHGAVSAIEGRHAAVKASLKAAMDAGASESEALRKVSRMPEHQNHFKTLHAHMGLPKTPYAKFGAASPALIAGGAALAAAAREKKKKEPTEFTRRIPTIHRIVDATRKNTSVSSPSLPGEEYVRAATGNKTIRSILLRTAGAGALVGGGLMAGHKWKYPKTGAVLGGLGAGLFLR